MIYAVILCSVTALVALGFSIYFHRILNEQDREIQRMTKRLTDVL